MNTDNFHIRLVGQGIKPGLIRSKEIAELLEAIEDMVVSEAIKSEPELGKDQIVVGLYEVRDRSVGLGFKCNLAHIVIPAFISAAVAVEEGNYQDLTSASVRSLEQVSSFAKRHGCNAEFYTGENSTPISKITPETVIPKRENIVGATQILGKILRVGGKKPRAMIETPSGSVLYCDLPLELAKEMGHYLYKEVLFNGVAEWDTETHLVEAFSITSVDQHSALNPVAAMHALSSELGRYFSNVKNVPEFCNELRREGGLG